MKAAHAWIVATALLTACASSGPTTGLANAPKLGTSPSHARPPYDVVADGRDSCEREATTKPPSWSRSPPCVASAVAEPVVLTVPSPPARPWVPRSRWSIPSCDPTDRGCGH